MVTCRAPAFAALLAALFSTSASAGTDPYFTGTVIDSLSGRPLSGVEIYLAWPGESRGDTLHTDAQGRFAIPEAAVMRSLGAVTGLRPAPSHGAEAPTGGALFRVDGRRLPGDAEASRGFESVQPARPEALRKAGRAQGGPMFRFSKTGYRTLENRIRALALDHSIHHPDFEPDYDLIIPMVPVSR